MTYAKVSTQNKDWNGTDSFEQEFGIKPEQFSVSERSRKPKTGNGRGWRERNKTGDIIVSNYDGSGLRAVSDPPVCRIRRHYGSNGLHGLPWETVETATCESQPPLNMEIINSVITRSNLELTKEFQFDNGLITRTLAESKEAQIDLLTSIAETPETVKMVIDVIKGVRNPLKAMANHRKALKRRKTHAIDKATETWLLYRYGIVPAMLTAADLMAALSDEYRKYQTSRGRERDLLAEYTEPLNVGFGAYGYHANVVEMAEAVVQQSITRSVVIKNCFDANSWQRNYGLNPAITAWELIPLSFVVDWFVQVGDTITAMHPSYESKQGATFALKHSLKVTLRPSETADLWEPPSSANFSSKQATVVLGEQFAEYWKYDRVVISPESHLTLPVGAKLNLKRTLDGFSLTWPAIKREFQSLIGKKG